MKGGIMKLQSRITVFVAILIFLSSLAIANENEDSRDALRAIIDTIKSPGYINSGSGSASVVIDENGKKIERILDFKFKDVISRSDAYKLSSGEKGDLDVIWAVNRKNSVVYNGSYAGIESTPPGQFHRQIGYDFHPETFYLIRDVPLETWLQGLADSAPTMSINLDNEGILHIYGEGKFEEDKNESTRIDLDTRKGYRLVYWDLKIKNGDGSSSEAYYKAEWQKEGSQWYIGNAHYESNVIKYGEDGKPKKFKYQKDIKVNDFAPNPEIQDTEFTLAALNIPHGTRIHDDIVGINYKYGSGAIGTENLEDPLLEAEFVKSIKYPVGTNKISEDANTVEEQTEENTKSSVSNKQFSQKSLVPILGQHTYRNVLIVVVVFIGIMLGLYIVGKSLFIQKGK
jgi:hypothetical protein